MAKLKTSEIIQSDLIDYLNGFSDFGFELSVLKMLRGKEIDCEHGGHYEDPITKKSREYDIRATKTHDKYTVRLAVECKNIRDNFPIVVSCVPRESDECYHQVSCASDSFARPMRGIVGLSTPRSKTIDVWSESSIYKECAPVGKSTVQVGRNNDGSITANDSELYEKWGQSLSSAHELIERMYNDGCKSPEIYLSIVIPIVVVPNGRLWSVEYDENGARLNDPTQVDRCSCFVGKEYSIRQGVDWQTYRISHLEIMTMSGLESFVDSYLGSADGLELLFSKQAMKDAIRESLYT